MILANEVLASHLESREGSVRFNRNTKQPDPRRKWHRSQTFVATFGFKFHTRKVIPPRFASALSLHGGAAGGTNACNT